MDIYHFKKNTRNSPSMTVVCRAKVQAKAQTQPRTQEAGQGPAGHLGLILVSPECICSPSWTSVQPKLVFCWFPAFVG